MFVLLFVLVWNSELLILNLVSALMSLVFFISRIQFQVHLVSTDHYATYFISEILPLRVMSLQNMGDHGFPQSRLPVKTK